MGNDSGYEGLHRKLAEALREEQRGKPPETKKRIIIFESEKSLDLAMGRIKSVVSRLSWDVDFRFLGMLTDPRRYVFFLRSTLAKDNLMIDLADMSMSKEESVSIVQNLGDITAIVEHFMRLEQSIGGMATKLPKLKSSKKPYPGPRLGRKRLQHRQRLGRKRLQHRQRPGRKRLLSR